MDIEPIDFEDENEKRLFRPHLWRQRRSYACQIIKESRLSSVLDLGCGEGALLEILLNDTSISKVAGLDIDYKALALARRNCEPAENDFQYLRELPISLSLYRGSLVEADSRLADYDCITLLEVIEHLDAQILEKLPACVFGIYKPQVVIISTPNAEFNVNFPNLRYGEADATFRHWDHRFEWSRAQFSDWCSQIARMYNYTLEINGVGTLRSEPLDIGTGYCSQIAVFRSVEPKTAIVKLRKEHEQLYHVDYPYFEAQDFSYEYIIEQLKEKSDLIIVDWDNLPKQPILLISQYWDLLWIRQLCKYESCLKEVFKSHLSRSSFEMQPNQISVKILWDFVRPVFIESAKCDESEEENDCDSEVVIIDENWGQVFTAHGAVWDAEPIETVGTEYITNNTGW